MSNSNNRTDESACVIVSLFFRLIGEYIFLDLFHNVVCLKIRIKYMFYAKLLFLSYFIILHLH